MKDQSHLFSLLKKKKISHFNAGWRNFEIIIKDKLRVDGDKCSGFVDFELGKIYLDAKLDAEAARETLWHEMFHVMFVNCGLGGMEYLDRDYGAEEELCIQNEDLTRRTSRQLITAIELNRDLVKCLMNIE